MKLICIDRCKESKEELGIFNFSGQSVAVDEDGEWLESVRELQSAQFDCAFCYGPAKWA
jgi:hypothetical protein